MEIIAKKIEFYRNKLLDVSFRNQLINYRPKRVRSIGIQNLDPIEAYSNLVINKRKPQIKSLQSTDSTSFDDEITSEKGGRFKLYSRFNAEDLSKRLLSLYKQSVTAMDEQGFTILFLALGFLDWCEPSNPETVYKAPLLLIPVEMTRERSRDIYRVVWTEEDIFTNITLKIKLLELGVKLPEFEMEEDGADIGKYYALVEETIKNLDNWKVNRQESYLDLFSFSKLLMYIDLDPSRWPGEKNLYDHPILNHIFNPESSKDNDFDGFDASKVDTHLKSIDTYHVLDADSSQIAVIEDSKAGRNLIVEGPPGTGKSQTITNIIAELLASHKSVLFVSEKMAALKVVKNRLDEVGLGDYCLELHSHKAKKKDVVTEIQNTALKTRQNIHYDEYAFQELEQLKNELNNYIIAISTVLGKRNLTPQSLMGKSDIIRRHFANSEKNIPRFQFENIKEITESEWGHAKSRLIQITHILHKLGPFSTNPWKGTAPDVILPPDVDDVKRMIYESTQKISEFLESLGHLVLECGMAPISCLDDLRYSINTIKILKTSNPVDKDILLNPEWNTPNENALKLIELLKQYTTSKKDILQKMEPALLKQKNLESLIQEFSSLSTSHLKFFNSRYHHLKKIVLAQYLQKKKISDEEIIHDLQFIQNTIQIREIIQKSHNLGLSLFGSLWHDENSNPDALEEFKDWIVKFRHEILKEKLTEKAASIVSEGIKQEDINFLLKNIQRSYKAFNTSFQFLSNTLKINPKLVFGDVIDKVPFKEIENKLQNWEKNIHSLIYWSNYIQYRNDCQNSLGQHIIPLIEADSLKPEDIVPCFEINYYDSLLHLAFVERPALRQFLGISHEDKIKRFRVLDDKIIRINRLRLQSLLNENLPDLSKGPSGDMQKEILLREVNKKKRHLPIRTLLIDAGELIRDIKPCFMMSPLSVAQYLDPKAIKKFDVVIFDEASQVRPEDALGALLRGCSTVIMGDSRQLPPTSFFDKLVDIEEEFNEESPEYNVEMESILNLCKTSLPSKTLRWHYRSRHESLIAVSNREFYDNKLMVYPSPMKESSRLGLKLIHLPHTRYDRGRSRTNREEAKAVANHVAEHFSQYPEKSLMVGTFSVAQQIAIQDEIEKIRDANPELEFFFNRTDGENFAVKNLETIQGDERDVVFVSVGYGIDETGRLSSNFGPLNRDGGERRLNVLVTRAREKCVVFSNFRSIDLDLVKSEARGVRILQSFLHYAEHGDFPLSTTYREDTESPFETDVFEFLKSKGYMIHPQVGCAGFRIDLGVVDPKIPGKYVLGIECDGAMYHSSPVARDRDKIRQKILEDLGWNLYRIWSTDWYRDPVESEKALLSAVNSALMVDAAEIIDAK